MTADYGAAREGGREDAEEGRHAAGTLGGSWAGGRQLRTPWMRKRLSHECQIESKSSPDS